MSATSQAIDVERLQKALKKCSAEWVSLARSTGSTDRAAVTASVSALYRLLELPTPIIVFCESPWQMVAMKAVLETGFTREKLQAVLDRHRTQKIEFPIGSQNSAKLLWQRLWSVLDEQISAESRQTLREAKIEEEEYSKKNGWNIWFKNVSKNQPFLRTSSSDDETETETFGWIWLRPKISKIQNQMISQLEGVSAGSLGSGLVEKLKSSFRSGATPTAGQLPLGRLTQIATEMMLLNVDLMPKDLIPHILNPGEPIFRLAQAAITGNLKVELDKTFPAEERDVLALWMSFTLAFAHSWDGPSSIGLLPFFDILYEQKSSIPIGQTNLRRMKTFLHLAQRAASYLFTKNVCLVCERPLVFKVDEGGRLHSEDGPAIAYGDGFRLFSWHGTNVPQWIINDPQSITVAKIDKEINAELRRIMIERYGASRYILDSGAVVIDKDECGVLYRKEVRNDEAIVMVKVRNSTPEPDGTYRDYFLRVPPTITKARDAVAWTFDMKPEEYKPSKES
jgi:hypothetical protein